jgi:hypothetical protein
MGVDYLDELRALKYIEILTKWDVTDWVYFDIYQTIYMYHNKGSLSSYIRNGTIL